MVGVQDAKRSNLDDVPRIDRPLGSLQAIHINAIPAAQIAHRHRVGAGNELRMPPRQQIVLVGHIASRIAPDDEPVEEHQGALALSVADNQSLAHG